MRLKPWIAVTAFCFGLIVLLGFIKFMQIRAAIAFGESFPEPSETVEVQKAAFSEWQAKISVIGEVRASRELLLRNEVEGVIAKIGFVSGAQVKAGDVLVQLDTGEEQARLKAIAPQIKLARLDVERLSGLVNKQAVSQQEADRVAAQLAVAEGQAASVRETIANKTIVAPFDGFAGLHDFELGEFVPANTMITKLVGDLDTLWVDFSLPQKYSNLSTGTQVLLEADEFGSGQLTAAVYALESSISAESRSLKARAVFANKNRLIKPGAIVKVLAPVGDLRKIIRLPNTAVRMDAFGAYVFALKNDDNNQLRAHRKPVTVTAKEGYESIIIKGLEPGEVIATTGSFKLRPGLLVYQSKDQDQIGVSPQGSASGNAKVIPKSTDSAD